MSLLMTGYTRGADEEGLDHLGDCKMKAIVASILYIHDCKYHRFQRINAARKVLTALQCKQ